ncbi:hypothetical protein FALBO_1668 [Fusarium albosuccineum]|uniref:Uncharacterized protein n=1 Tax=Fusarium albosuccineum TaxID=1237068 RepID=A0A8H4PIC1_9HYPO|nr:hypothetical protein FALBO_1668 [Fusarium albosuccineum]
MVPSVEYAQSRWYMEAKRGFGAGLPDWTTADDSDHEYDVTIMRRRRLRPKARRDNIKIASRAANVRSSTSRSIRSTIYERSNNDDSESESESDPEESEPEANVDEGKAKLPAQQDAPTLAAPSAEGSVSGSVMVSLSSAATVEKSLYNDLTGASLIGPKLLTTKKISDSDGIHSNVHKILLGVGSVGGFLLLIGIGLIAWKLFKRRSQRKRAAPVDDMAFEKPSRFENLVSKVPFIGSRFGHQGWYTIDDPSQDNMEKTQPAMATAPASRRLNSEYFAPDKPLGVYRMGSTRTAGTRLDADAVSPTSTMFVERTAVQVQVVARHDPKESITSFHKPQHTRVPSTTPYAYDLGRRQTGVSELSSISSGFGDGDIVVTPTNQTIQTLPSQPGAVAAPSRQSTWRSTNTWRSTSTLGGKRDTMSTEASVDVRPRFHTVNSWVKQQNGHLRRAQQEYTSDGDTPPVPALAPPPEQDFRLMMPDGERPRPVEMV